MNLNEFDIDNDVVYYRFFNLITFQYSFVQAVLSIIKDDLP